MRLIAFIFFFLASVLAVNAETNFTCVVCGKTPLTGRIWMSKWGAVCDDCYKLENHCSLCGLPIGKDFVKTGDGRFICKFDKTNAVLTATSAQEVFADTRREMIEQFGRGFVLNFPDVTVNLFDVDYWSEKGREDGLHKFGFSYTRKTRAGDCTHEVVLLSGRLRAELAATAAHEYTHLWINENRPPEHAIDGDTTEAICELAAYKLMQAQAQAEQLENILTNPYTHGAIKKLVALEQENGIGYILNWVKNGTTATFETDASALATPAKRPSLTFTNMPAPLPVALKLGGLMLAGEQRRAIVSGVSFAPGETKSVKLKNRTVQVRCREINNDNVVLEVDGWAEPLTLKIGEEKFAP
ncbi:MAG: hypothetical protein WCK57_08625 [Verrucomicrobiae bacterium]